MPLSARDQFSTLAKKGVVLLIVPKGPSENVLARDTRAGAQTHSL